jgi:hypothetical protein
MLTGDRKPEYTWATGFDGVILRQCSKYAQNEMQYEQSNDTKKKYNSYGNDYSLKSFDCLCEF